VLARLRQLFCCPGIELHLPRASGVTFPLTVASPRRSLWRSGGQKNYAGSASAAVF
jgi:hypothetical protein